MELFEELGGDLLRAGQREEDGGEAEGCAKGHLSYYASLLHMGASGRWQGPGFRRKSHFVTNEPNKCFV